MITTLRQVYHVSVFTPKGKRVGRVVDALFAPVGASVVGYVVERPRLLFLFDRKDFYLARDSSTLGPDGFSAASGRDVWNQQAAKRLGIDWEQTAIWSGMPVRTRSGEKLGTIRDGRFDTDTGELLSIDLSSGAAADVALGTRGVSGALVDGYTEGFVVVSDEAGAAQVSGGVAAAAGKQAAVARVQAEQAVAAAGAATKKAVAYGKAAAKVAAQSESGKKAMGWLKSLKDEIVDAMGDPEDDDE